MLGYHVFYSVTGSKKPYTMTECYLSQADAYKRSVELAVASNISLVTVRTVEIKSIHLEVIKGYIEK